MIVFVDTSAFYAVLDRDDEHHKSSIGTWKSLLQKDAILVTSNYVLVETCALLQHRLGIEAVRTFQQQIVPLLAIEWIGAAQHGSAIAALLTASRKKLSLVDCVSFAVMREAGIAQAFAFDRHFVEQGFECQF
jgi:predicted nucleic acid-binding protein